MAYREDGNRPGVGRQKDSQKRDVHVELAQLNLFSLLPTE